MARIEAVVRRRSGLPITRDVVVDGDFGEGNGGTGRIDAEPAGCSRIALRVPSGAMRHSLPVVRAISPEPEGSAAIAIGDLGRSARPARFVN